MNNKGFTFLEILISLTILVVALLGFFQIFNTALNSSYRAMQETIATNLARGLMAEIMSKNFEDPTAPSPSFGIEAGETRHGGVNAFDDVDDYNSYTDGPPPVAVGGLPMDETTDETPNYSGFTRSVTVSYCDIVGSDIVDVAGPTDYKHITVTVSGPYVRGITINEVKAKEE